MLGRIWQWLKRLFQQLFSQGGKLKLSQEAEDSTAQLSDTDYEFLFHQLLEGVAHGWHEGRILTFFSQLSDRTKPREWVAWLERFGAKLLASPAPNHQLAVLMMRLGEQTQSQSSIQKFGELSYSLGRQLLTRETSRPIWEFDGPDVNISTLDQVYQEEDQIESVTLPLPELNLITSDREDEQVFLEETEVENITLPLPDLSIVPDQIEDEQLYREETEVENVTLPLPDLSIVPDQIEDEQVFLEETEVENVTLPLPDLSIVPDQIEDEQVYREEDQIENVTVQLSEDNFNSTESSINSDLISAEDLFYQGLEQADAKNFQEAIALWEQALEINPNLSHAWHNRGSALGNLGRLEQAIASFEQAIEIKPDDYQAWHDRGQALYKLKRWEEAIASWQEVIKIKPDYYRAWYAQGQALSKLARWEEAIASWQEVIKIKPDYYRAWYAQGCALEKLGKKAEAVAAYEQARKSDPDFPETKSKSQEIIPQSDPNTD